MMVPSALTWSFGLLIALHELVQCAATYSQMTTTANKTAINSYDPLVAQAMAALAKLAYCGIGPDPFLPYGTAGGFQGATKRSCGSFCTEAGFSLGRLVLVSAADGGQQNANFAYVAQLRPARGKTPPADCALAFRGTWVSPANSDRNLETELVDWPMPSCRGKSCKVHKGAKGIWDTVKGEVARNLKGLGCKSVVVTGHSLGGQLAALAMFSLQDQYGYKVELSYTFEGSVPFNAATTTVFDGGLFGRAISMFRITHTSDQVPTFPWLDGYLQPGSQVWFYGPRAQDFVHCGTLAQAPKCGLNGLPKDTLCSLTSNPSWKKCGGYAPFGGPHCTHPVAPASNFCDMAGSSITNFAGATIYNCQLGNKLLYNALHPTVPPQVFPLDSALQAARNSTPKGSTTGKNATGGGSVDDALPSCWTQNTAYVPLGMLGKVAIVKPTPSSCQEYCTKTQFCEYVSWWKLPSGGGLCHVSGGWAHQQPMSGAMSGPKSCATPLAEESSVDRAVYMEIKYLQSLAGGAPSPFGAHSPFVRFNERGFWRAVVPTELPLGTFVAFGISMLVVGAATALLLARTFSLLSARSRGATREIGASMLLATEDGME